MSDESDNYVASELYCSVHWVRPLPRFSHIIHVHVAIPHFLDTTLLVEGNTDCITFNIINIISALLEKI